MIRPLTWKTNGNKKTKIDNDDHSSAIVHAVIGYTACAKEQLIQSPQAWLAMVSFRSRILCTSPLHCGQHQNFTDFLISIICKTKATLKTESLLSDANRFRLVYNSKIDHDTISNTVNPFLQHSSDRFFTIISKNPECGIAEWSSFSFLSTCLTHASLGVYHCRVFSLTCVPPLSIIQNFSALTNLAYAPIQHVSSHPRPRVHDRKMSSLQRSQATKWPQRNHLRWHDQLQRPSWSSSFCTRSIQTERWKRCGTAEQRLIQFKLQSCVTFLGLCSTNSDKSDYRFAYQHDFARVGIYQWWLATICGDHRCEQQ